MTEDWITRLGLAPHPEGGWFRRIHTEPRQVQTELGLRAAASSIHYLLTTESPTGHLHSNRSTILHFLQSGGPVEYLLIDPSGQAQRITLGSGSGQVLQFVAPGGSWKASRLLPGTDHALVSEVVVPGWDAADHSFITAEQLLQRCPTAQADWFGLLR